MDPDSESGSRSMRAKITHKSRKIRNLMFCSARCSLLRAEGFFCSLDVLSGGLGIGKFKFLIKKFCCKFLSIFGHQNSGSGLDPDRCSA